MKSLTEIVIAVIDGQQGRPSRPQVFLHRGAVDFFGDSPAQRIVDIRDDSCIRQSDLQQLAGCGVAVSRGGASLYPCRQIVVGVELVGDRPGGQGMVLQGVGEGPTGDAQLGVHLVGAIAVVVIPVLLDQVAVPGDGEQPAQRIIAIFEQAARPGDGFGPAHDPAAVVPGEIVAVDGARDVNAEAVHFAVVVERSTESECPIGDFLRQSIVTFADDRADWRSW